MNEKICDFPGTISLVSRDNDEYRIDFENPLPAQRDGADLMVAFFERGRKKSQMGAVIRDGERSFDFRSGYDIGSGEGISLMMFVDSNGDYSLEGEIYRGTAEFSSLSELEQGISFFSGGKYNRS